MRHAGWMATAGLTIALSVVPAGARAENLTSAMTEAYVNSPDLANQRANIKIASENAVQARAGGRISVTGSGNIQANTPEFDDVRMPSALNLNIVQPLYTGGRVTNETTAAEHRITRQEAALKDTERNVLFEAAVAYLNVKRREALLRTAQNSVRVLSEQLEAATGRFEVGEITRTDVEQARARLAASRSNLAAATGALENARDDYRRAIGRAPAELDPAPPIPDLPNSEDEAIRIAVKNDPALLAARLERKASAFDVKAAIGTLLPQLSLQGRVTQTTVFDEDFDDIDDTHDAALGLFLTIPFYSGGANYSRVREARATVQASDAVIIAELRNIRENIGEAWSDLEVARAQITAGNLGVQAAKLAFEGVQEEAKVGSRTTLDALDAEQEVLDAHDNLIDAQTDEQISAYALLRAMGLMTAEHLGLDVGDPNDESAYNETALDRDFGYDRTDETVWSLGLRP